MRRFALGRVAALRPHMHTHTHTQQKVLVLEVILSCLDAAASPGAVPLIVERPLGPESLAFATYIRHSLSSLQSSRSHTPFSFSLDHRFGCCLDCHFPSTHVALVSTSHLAHRTSHTAHRLSLPLSSRFSLIAFVTSCSPYLFPSTCMWKLRSSKTTNLESNR